MRSAVALTVLWSFTASATELPPIIKEATPGDALFADPILPARRGASPAASSSGSLEHGIGHSSALPITEQARPGSFSQVRGLGRSAEDMNVQTLGIPLNGPQGGGFDFSIFPSFMWSDFEVQNGPSLGAFDPRGVAGSVSLTPWSASAIGKRTIRATALASDRALYQFSGAASSGDHAAVLGYTAGDAHGPSGALSGRWQATPRFTGYYHLLGTNLDTKVVGSRSYPTPENRQQTVRLIPFVQGDYEFSSEMTLKASAFADGTYLRTEDPQNSFNHTRSQTRHYGSELALLMGAWRIGGGARVVTYESLAAQPPRETLANLFVSRSFESFDGSGEWLVEPSARAVSVSRYGTYPEASLGARRSFEGDAALFARATYSRRMPSLLDRYYAYDSPFLITRPNPDLDAERDWTGIIGAEWGRPASVFRGSLQGYAQLREDTVSTVNSTQGSASVYQKKNLGQARVFSVLGDVAYRPFSFIEVREVWTLSSSRLESADRSIPYLPDYVNVFSLMVDPGFGRGGLVARSTGPAWAAASGDGRVGATTSFDLETSYFVSDQARIIARIENLFDRPYETILDYPTPGRVFSLALLASF